MRRMAAAAGGLAALGAVTTPWAGATSLSGPANPPTDAEWANASHGELLGTNQISSGDVVAFWQGFLASYGAVSCPGGINGRFGPATVTGTKSIQGFFGLTQDGIVGPQTWGAAGSWLSWSPGTSTYDLWQPFASGKPEVTYSHTLPNGAWKWQSVMTADYPQWHSSDTSAISFVTSGSC
jgi:hypothetical protein